MGNDMSRMTRSNSTRAASSSNMQNEEEVQPPQVIIQTDGAGAANDLQEAHGSAGSSDDDMMEMDDAQQIGMAATNETVGEDESDDGPHASQVPGANNVKVMSEIERNRYLKDWVCRFSEIPLIARDKKSLVGDGTNEVDIALRRKFYELSQVMNALRVASPVLHKRIPEIEVVRYFFQSKMMSPDVKVDFVAQFGSPHQTNTSICTIEAFLESLSIVLFGHTESSDRSSLLATYENLIVGASRPKNMARGEFLAVVHAHVAKLRTAIDIRLLNETDKKQYSDLVAQEKILQVVFSRLTPDEKQSMQSRNLLTLSGLKRILDELKNGTESERKSYLRLARHRYPLLALLHSRMSNRSMSEDLSRAQALLSNNKRNGSKVKDSGFLMPDGMMNDEIDNVEQQQQQQEPEPGQGACYKCAYLGMTKFHDPKVCASHKAYKAKLSSQQNNRGRGRGRGHNRGRGRGRTSSYYNGFQRGYKPYYKRYQNGNNNNYDNDYNNNNNNDCDNKYHNNGYNKYHNKNKYRSHEKRTDDSERRSCHRCLEKGHLIKDCPYTSQEARILLRELVHQRQDQKQQLTDHERQVMKENNIKDNANINETTVCVDAMENDTHDAENEDVPEDNEETSEETYSDNDNIIIVHQNHIYQISTIMNTQQYTKKYNKNKSQNVALFVEAKIKYEDKIRRTFLKVDSGADLTLLSVTTGQKLAMTSDKKVGDVYFMGLFDERKAASGEIHEVDVTFPTIEGKQATVSTPITIHKDVKKSLMGIDLLTKMRVNISCYEQQIILPDNSKLRLYSRSQIKKLLADEVAENMITPAEKSALIHEIGQLSTEEITICAAEVCTKEEAEKVQQQVYVRNDIISAAESIKMPRNTVTFIKARVNDKYLYGKTITVKGFDAAKLQTVVNKAQEQLTGIHEDDLQDIVLGTSESLVDIDNEGYTIIPFVQTTQVEYQVNKGRPLAVAETIWNEISNPTQEIRQQAQEVDMITRSQNKASIPQNNKKKHVGGQSSHFTRSKGKISQNAKTEVNKAKRKVQQEADIDKEKRTKTTKQDERIGNEKRTKTNENQDKHKNETQERYKNKKVKLTRTEQRNLEISDKNERMKLDQLAQQSRQPFMKSKQITNTQIDTDLGFHEMGQSHGSTVVDALPQFGSTLTAEQLKQVKDLVNDKKYHEGLWASDKNTIGKAKDYEPAKIMVEAGAENKIYTRQYPLSSEQRKEAMLQIERLVKTGLIRRVGSKTKFANSLLVIPRPGPDKTKKRFRLVLDLRKLNRHVIYPYNIKHHSINEVIDQTKGSMFYTSLDISSAYESLEVHEESSKYLRFEAPNGIYYEHLRLPYGLKISGFEFASYMTSLIAKLTGTIAYCDDVLIQDNPTLQTTRELQEKGLTAESESVETRFNRHLTRLKELLDTLLEQNLRIQLGKCSFFAKKIVLLGHMIDYEGVSPHPRTLQQKKLKGFERPTNKTQLRALLGWVQFFRKSIPMFASRVSLLQELLASDGSSSKSLKWSKAAEKQFQDITKTCLSCPILAHFDPSLPIVVMTDACSYAVGAALIQVQNGQRRLIEATSRALNQNERALGIAFKEAIAISHGLKKFHHYIHGRQFILESDNKALICVYNHKDLPSQLLRWLVSIQQYQFELRHVKGKDNPIADFLSREKFTNEFTIRDQISNQGLIVYDDADVREINENNTARGIAAIQSKEDIKIKTIARVSWIPEQEEKFLTEFRQAQAKKEYMSEIENINEFREHQMADMDFGPILKFHLYGDVPRTKVPQFLQKCSQFIVDKDTNILYHKKAEEETKEGIRYSYRLCIPKVELHHALRTSHELLYSAHRGVLQTLSFFRERFYAINEYSIVKKYVLSCKECQESAQRREKQLISGKITATRPGELLAYDIIGPLPRTAQGDQYLFGAIDAYTRFSYWEAIPDQNATSIARALRQYFANYGIPKYVLCDNAAPHRSKIMSELRRLLQFKQIYSTPLMPTTNGLIERSNKNMVGLLKRTIQDYPKHWSEAIAYYQYTLNTAKHRITGETPYFLMFGRRPQKLPVDFKFTLPDNDILSNTTREKNLERLQLAQKKIAQHQKELDEQTRKRNDQILHESKKKYPVFTLGQRVTVNQPYKAGSKYPKKFHRPATAGYVVMKRLSPNTYECLHPNGKHKRKIHISRMYPFKEREVELKDITKQHLREVDFVQLPDKMYLDLDEDEMYSMFEGSEHTAIKFMSMLNEKKQRNK